jgi:3-methyladenine DNA glycosylase AlkD
MGVAEDVRKSLRDLVTPEMRALASEVKANNEKIVDLRAEMDRRFDYIERSFRLDERITAVEDQIRKPSKRQESH